MGMDLYGKAPKNETGKYFRASCWSWRPIHDLCDKAIAKAGLGFNTQAWAYNDGAGLDSQPDCDRLADALEALLREKEGIQRFDLDLGGCYVNAEPTEVVPGMRGRTISDSKVKTPGTIPAWNTNREHVEEFVSFLRACGGFEIN